MTYLKDLLPVANLGWSEIVLSLCALATRSLYVGVKPLILSLLETVLERLLVACWIPDVAVAEKWVHILGL